MSEFLNEDEKKLAELESQSKKFQKHNNKYYADGIYVKKIKIKSVENKSNHPIKYPNNFSFNSGHKPECCLVIHYEYETILFGEQNITIKEGTTYLMSNWDWKDSKQKVGFNGFKVASWNPVYNFMKQVIPASEIMKGYEVKDLPDFSQVKDMEFYMLSYYVGEGTGTYAGKPQYNTYEFLLPAVDNNDDFLVDDFKERQEKKGEYSKWKPADYLAYKKSKKNNNSDTKLDLDSGEDVNLDNLPF